MTLEVVGKITFDTYPIYDRIGNTETNIERR